MVEFCDLLGTPYAPVSKIPSFHIFDQWPKLSLGFDVEPEIPILKVIYYL
jgi:hypothetical protein